MVLFTLIFIVLAVLVNTGLIADLENSIYYAMIQYQSIPLTGAAKIVSWFFNPQILPIICLALFVFPHTRRTIAFPVSASAGVAAVLNVVLKRIFARERPDILRLVEETSFSFPSGHSMASAAVGAILFFLILLYIDKPIQKILLCLISILIPFLVGLSRIYLGVHYAGDVFGGWLMGATVGIAISILWERMNKGRLRQSS